MYADKTSNVVPVKMKGTKEIKVTVRIPENVQERVRQQKINQIYDILAAKDSC